MQGAASALRLAACLWLVGGSAAVAAEDFAFFHENVLGTSLELRVRADSAKAAEHAEARVLREIDRLALIFSGYDPASEFRRWQETHNRPVPVSSELFDVLRASDRWREASRGAFEPRVQVLTQLWSARAQEGRTPTPQEIAEAKAQLAGPAWRLDETTRTAERLTACPLSLNAIAKGDIVDRACADAMKEPGVLGLLLSIGGDLKVRGDYARRIGIVDPSHDSETSEPLTHVELRGRALANSGASQRGFRIGDRWYSHILDPRAGAPAGTVLGASVIADQARDADALATVCCVLPVEESLKLIETVPGAACLIVTADGKVTRSGGWSRYETERPARVSLVSRTTELQESAKASTVSWGDTFEMAVRFEINPANTKTRHYNRPYLAIWIEDQAGKPVRTLTLWIRGDTHGLKFLHELRRWYRTDKGRQTAQPGDLVPTISRPTRPPGKYEIVWDGKDDQGKPLAAGAYTLTIEASREHGTYQIIRKPLTIADQPFAETLQGNVEIKSASVEYRRKPAAP